MEIPGILKSYSNIPYSVLNSRNLEFAQSENFRNLIRANLRLRENRYKLLIQNRQAL